MNRYSFYLCIRQNPANKYRCYKHASIDEADGAYYDMIKNNPYFHKRYASTVVPVSNYVPEGLQKYAVLLSLYSDIDVVV